MNLGIIGKGKPSILANKCAGYINTQTEPG